MRVNIFLAVGLGVAVKHVLDAVRQTAQPSAVNHVFNFFAIENENLQ